MKYLDQKLYVYADAVIYGNKRLYWKQNANTDG